MSKSKFLLGKAVRKGNLLRSPKQKGQSDVPLFSPEEIRMAQSRATFHASEEVTDGSSAGDA